MAGGGAGGPAGGNAGSGGGREAGGWTCAEGGTCSGRRGTCSEVREIALKGRGHCPKGGGVLHCHCHYPLLSFGVCSEGRGALQGRAWEGWCVGCRGGPGRGSALHAPPLTALFIRVRTLEQARAPPTTAPRAPRSPITPHSQGSRGRWSRPAIGWVALLGDRVSRGRGEQDQVPRLTLCSLDPG